MAAIFRRRRSRHDFSDKYGSQVGRWDGQQGGSRRIFGRPFVTAGWIVVGVSLLVAGLELGLLILVSELSHTK